MNLIDEKRQEIRDKLATLGEHWRRLDAALANGEDIPLITFSVTSGLASDIRERLRDIHRLTSTPHYDRR